MIYQFPQSVAIKLKEFLMNNQKEVMTSQKMNLRENFIIQRKTTLKVNVVNNRNPMTFLQSAETVFALSKNLKSLKEKMASF
jgi:hypothetical protein